jgi:molybdopterin converting factor small subunit
VDAVGPRAQGTGTGERETQDALKNVAATPVRVRLFAAARAAAGGVSELDCTARTLAEVRTALVRWHGSEMDRVLAACSYLVDGTVAVRREEDVSLVGVGVVDVLPPFAGG